MQRRENAGHAAANAMVSVVAPVDRRGGASVRSTTLLQARRQELPGTARVPTPEDRLDSTRLVTALELTVPVARGALVARGWGRRDDLRTASGGSVVAPARALSDDALTAIGASVAFRRRGRGAAVDARADLIGERFAPGTRIGGPQPAGADRRAVGGGFDVELSELKPLTLNGSARLDVYADGADGEIDRQDTLPTAHLGADLDLGPLSLVAHGGRVARPASFVERYGNRATFLGNPDLRFESAWAADAGLRAARRVGPLRARAELVGFATWATDLITFVPQGAFGLLRASNIGRAHVRGAEADVEAKLGGAELRAVYTLMATENQSLCTFAFSGAPCARPALPGRPAHDLFADAAYRFGRLRVRYGVDVVSGITTDLSATLDVPSRALHSVGASLEVPGIPGLRLAFDLRNLFDLRSVAYAGATGPLRRPIGDSYDFPIPGRNLLVTARWTSPAP